MDIGRKLRSLRQQKNLTQEQLADRCELSKGFISQVERNLASPSIATLTDMLECLGSDLKAFFSDPMDERVTFSPADMFEKADPDGLKSTVTWLVPTAQKNRMEPILVELEDGGRTSEMPPFEGEEFGYVLQGSVVLFVGDRKYRVAAGESFCLHPGSPHHIENAGKRRAKVLWISNPPMF